MEKQKKTFMAACKDFFGFKPGQRPTEFAAEVKALSPEDRVELTAMLGTVGYEIVETPAS